MDFEKIVSHCVVIEITKCENEDYWYSDRIGEHFVAFKCDGNDIYCCHIDNQYHTVAVVPIVHCKVVQGSLDALWDMN